DRPHGGGETVVHDDQIVVGVEWELVGVERTFRLRGGPHQFLGERAGGGKSHGPHGKSTQKTAARVQPETAAHAVGLLRIGVGWRGSVHLPTLNTIADLLSCPIGWKLPARYTSTVALSIRICLAAEAGEATQEVEGSGASRRGSVLDRACGGVVFDVEGNNLQ